MSAMVGCRQGAHEMCATMSALVSQVFGYILVPKFLIIENFRLGVLCRFLQFCAVCLVVTQILVEKQWIYYSEPQGDVYFLSGVFPHTGADRHDAADEYCQNIAQYDYSADASGALAMKPTECLDVPNGRRVVATGGSSILVPTYVVEKQQTFESSACGALQTSCAQAGDIFFPTSVHPEAGASELRKGLLLTEEEELPKEKGGGFFEVAQSRRAPTARRVVQGCATRSVGASFLCVCENKHEYFVSKPEATRIELAFRFEASQEDAGKKKERGSSDTRIYKPHSIDMSEEPYKIETLEHQIVTTLRPKGSKDQVVQGLRFSSSTGQTVSIPVGAFLEAAGLGSPAASLDGLSGYANHRHSTNASLPLQNSLKPSAAFRATGVDISVSIDCSRKDVSVFEEQDKNIYCDLYCDTEPSWTTHEEPVIDQYNSRTQSGNLKMKKQHGVRLSFRFTGRLGYFSMGIFLSSLTSAIVLLELPGKAVMLLALFCLGLLSRVYYSCQSQRLNIRHQVHGFAARLINAKKSYEAIVKSDKMDVHLDRETLAKEMQDSFHHLCEEQDEEGNPIQDPARPLQRDELEKMTDLVYHGLDLDQQGSISVDEYVDASTSNEVLRVDQICAFFDEERHRHCLERLFDDTKMTADTSVRKRGGSKSTSANDSPKPVHAADIFMNL